MAAVTASAAVVLAACTPTPPQSAASSSQTAVTTPAGSTPTRSVAVSQPATAPIPITHVHGIARDPKTGDLLLATHEGLFRQVGGQLLQTGPVIDLMGFAVGPDGTFYASGHPGVGVNLPRPVGLLTSADGGRTWQQQSRGGQSDFHALTVGPTNVTGFDGALRTSTDRKAWTGRAIPAEPRNLAASPRTGRLLATTAQGLLASSDNGATWTSLHPPETVVLAAWADESTIVVITTSARLATSTDAGATWTLHPKSLGAVEAMAATRTRDGALEVLWFVGGKALSTIDNAATTTVLVQ